MTQIEWRTFEKGDAAALAALFRDGVMQLTLACYDTAARLCAPHTVSRGRVSRCSARKSSSATAYH
jgi:hypothetical protein